MPPGRNEPNSGTYEDKEAVHRQTSVRILTIIASRSQKVKPNAYKNQLYASLISALSDRLNLNTYYITSYNHAWNLVSIEGVNYYVDATWFDGLAAKIDVNLTAEEAINLGKNEELDWYMEEPRNDYDDTHKAIDIPLFVKVTSITSDDNSFENFEEKQFKIEIGSKIFVVGGGILIGIMCGLGLAYISKGKQKKFDLNSFENSNIREAENYNFNESVSHKKR